MRDPSDPLPAPVAAPPSRSVRATPRRRVRAVFDYHLSWPIVVDHVMDRALEDVLSERLVLEIRGLVERWHREMAPGLPADDTNVAPEVLERFNRSAEGMKRALARELGDEFEVL